MESPFWGRGGSPARSVPTPAVLVKASEETCLVGPEECLLICEKMVFNTQNPHFKICPAKFVKKRNAPVAMPGKRRADGHIHNHINKKEPFETDFDVPLLYLH